jgi:hypothetical protein
LKKLVVAGLVMALGLAPAFAMAQASGGTSRRRHVWKLYVWRQHLGDWHVRESFW